jgi:DNA-binding winged helix-turn-helix (wHTH) protein
MSFWLVHGGLTMSEPEQTPRVLRFGAFELDRDAGELRKQGRLVALAGQPMRVLDLLASNAGRVVTRDELQHAIWGHDTHVDFEAGLSTCINQVRSALGDRAASPRFVETLPRRGFRFVAPVERLDDVRPVGPDTGAEPANDFVVKRRARRYWPAVAGVGAIVALAATNWLAPQPPTPVAVAPTPVALRPIPVIVLPVMLDRRLSKLEPLATALTDTIIGALATEAGPSLRVASPVAVRHMRDSGLTLDTIRGVGADYFVTVKLAPFGRRINVHAKVSTIHGWMLWSTDWVHSAADLELEQFSLSADLSKHVLREIQASEKNPRALAQAAGAGGHNRD